MAGQLRQNIVQRSREFGKNNRPSYHYTHISLKTILIIIAFSLLLLTPFLIGFSIIRTNVGTIAPDDRFSRVDFQWKVPNSDKIFKEVESTHLPIFENVPYNVWMNTVFEPIAELMEKAVDFRNSQKLLEYAKTQNIELTSKEADVLTRYLLSDIDQGIYSELINPARRAVGQWIYSKGVISDEQYNLAMANGGTKSIEVIRPDNLYSRGTIMVIGSENSPISLSQTSTYLQKGLYDKLWLVRQALRETIENILLRRVNKHPTLIYQEAISAETLKNRKELALKKASQISRGELIVERGQPITTEVFKKLRAENEAFNKQRGSSFNIKNILSKFILSFLVCLLFYIILNGRVRKKALIGTALTFIITVFITYLILLNGRSITLVPIGFLAGCVAIGSRRTIGMLITGIYGLFIISISYQQSAEILAIITSGCLFALLAPVERFRSGILKTSILCGIVGAMVYLCWYISDGIDITLPSTVSDFLSLNFSDSINILIKHSCWIFLTSILSFALILLCLHPIQRIFGATPNIILQDLQEHPLQNKLLLKAPSTYYHSSIAAALAEAGAYSCGANALLCRISCFYHDIGKLVKPEYFTENESGVSRHDILTPSMSALIIVSHVKDGVEMGRQNKLPPAIIDIIEQHHGTTLVSYFLRQAKEEAEDPDEIDEQQFRYPGPKPQFPEAAIVMIADSVEAASRSLEGASSASIRALVHKIIMGKLQDRQFDECSLSFTDLAKIEDSLVRVLQSMFHSRVKYDQKKSK